MDRREFKGKGNLKRCLKTGFLVKVIEGLMVGLPVAENPVGDVCDQFMVKGKGSESI